MFMLPEQGLAIIILANIRNGGDYAIFPFNDPVKRRIVEELFDGRDVASVMVDHYVALRRDVISSTLASLDHQPDPAWVRGLAGTYCNPSLGRITISDNPEGGLYDVGEWRSHFARKRDADGRPWLVLVDPPFAGGSSLVGGDETHPTMTVEVGQAKHVFTRESTTQKECAPKE